MVSPFFREETIALANKFDVTMIIDSYNNSYLEGKHIVVATTDKLM